MKEKFKNYKNITYLPENIESEKGDYLYLLKLIGFTGENIND